MQYISSVRSNGLGAAVHPVRGVITVMAVLAALLVATGTTISPAGAQDGPSVSVGDASGLERDDVIGSVFIPVSLSAPATEPVTINYFTVNDTAVYIPPEDRTDPELFGDYQRRGTPEIPRSVSIPAGSMQTTINVNLNVDDEVEFDEQFLVKISSVSGASATIGDDTGVATIVDADAVSANNPAITVSDVSIHEGDQGQRRAQVQVHLSRPPVSPVTISYSTVDGSASAPGDYTSKLPGTVVFAPGQISKTIDVLVGANGDVGVDRTFNLAVTVNGGSPVEEIDMDGTVTIVDDDAATPPPTLPVVPGVAGGNNHTCALDAAGSVKCWGLNTFGQLGTGDTASSLTPVAVTGLPEVTVAIAAGDSQTCALSETGAVRCWGFNGSGQLGDGTTTSRNAPVDVVGLTGGAVAIGAGDNHTCAALATGGMKCWGLGSQGRLGNGLTATSPVPVDVIGLPAGVPVTEIAAGVQHTCAVLANGAAMCWGNNGNGRLGIGTTVLSTTAVQPIGLDAGATSVAGGGAHTCVAQSGAVKCFGLNFSGQLGNGTVTSSTSPVTVSNLTGVSRVTGGGAQSCALTSGGGVKCWGQNSDGQLGIGLDTVNNSTTARDVVGLSSGQISITAGVSHTCAMAQDGTVRCWGLNDSGQLGNGNTTRQFSPVTVIGL